MYIYIIKFYLHSNIFIMIRQLFVPDFHSRIAKNWRKVPRRPIGEMLRFHIRRSLWYFMWFTWCYIYIYSFCGGFWNRGTPSHHPFIDRFSIVNHPALGLPPWLWNPPYIYIYIFTWVCQKSQWLLHQSFDLPDLTLVWNRQKTRYMGSYGIYLSLGYGQLYLVCQPSLPSPWKLLTFWRSTSLVAAWLSETTSMDLGQIWENDGISIDRFGMDLGWSGATPFRDKE